MDKNTLLQLRGATAKGYAFDKRYGQEVTSDQIYDDCVAQLVEAVFKVGVGWLAQHSRLWWWSACTCVLRSSSSST